MSPSSLSTYFRGVAAKRLSAVEVDPRRSHQHELDGTKALREIFGDERRGFRTRFLYLPDEADKTVSEDDELTWYDARERNPRRTEYRLYFGSSMLQERARAGDLLVIALRTNGSLLIVVAPRGSTAEEQLLFLFGLEDPSPRLAATPIGDRGDMGFVRELILEELGIEVEPVPSAISELETMLRTFGGGFPSTAEFSLFARLKSPTVSARDNPDLAVITWLRREEELFRVLERHLVSQRLALGFGENGADVDGFIDFSLSIQNRRKSRAGQAAEHHLAEVFEQHGLRFSRTPLTENKSKPDFIFPGQKEYADSGFSEDRLTMLAVKTSCKDRWRQILSEADRIQQKHLFTLQPAISSQQTEEMKNHRVQLVVPASLFPTFLPTQRRELMDLRSFVDEVRRINP